jgi:thiamine biosynthesis lipoprotein
MLLSCAQQRSATVELITGRTMGTTYHIKYVVDDGGALPAKSHLHAGVEAILAAIDKQMSTYRPDSELSRFNASRSSDWFAASADLVKVLQEARRVSELSQGAFDVTVGPLVELWGFGPDASPQRIPSPAALQAARSQVGFRHLELRVNPPAIRKHLPSVEVDLGAIAPGFAVDKLAAYLESQGVGSFLVELGGEVYGRGRRHDGQRWQVGIEEPSSASGEVDISLELDGQGLSTSGSYRNFFELNGRRYSHEIDPATGWPVQHDTVAVSVIAPTAMTADALSTALLVLGGDTGMQLALRHGLAARFANSSNGGLQYRQTPAFASALASSPPPENRAQ